MSRTDWRFSRRRERRAEAIERQAYYGGLTIPQKIAQCVGRRGESKKELARLKAQCS